MHRSTFSYYVLLLDDRLPSVGDSGDSGSSSTNRTLFGGRLLGVRRPRIDEALAGPVSDRNIRPAKGVYNGVLGVVDIWANSLTRAARLEGDVNRFGVVNGRPPGLGDVDRSSLNLKGDSSRYGGGKIGWLIPLMSGIPGSVESNAGPGEPRETMAVLAFSSQ